MLPQYMTIYVTDKDISEGKRRNPKECALALAVQRVLKRRGVTLQGQPPAFVVSGLGGFFVWFKLGEDHCCVIYETNTRVDNFVESFDAGGVVTPTKFRAHLADMSNL